MRATESDGSMLTRPAEIMRRLATVLADSNDAITLQRPDGTITAWNRGAERMYGYSKAEALGMNMRNIVPKGKHLEAEACVAQLIQGESVESLETQRVTKDGRVLDVWLTITAMRDNAGNPLAIAATERDITERKRAEEEIRTMNAVLEQRVIARTAELEVANKELEVFSYSMAHDLRAPLRGIAGFSQALLEDHAEELDEEGIDHVQRVRAAAQRMEQLIDDLMHLSRVARAEIRREAVNLSALAKTTAEELRKQDPARKAKFVIAEGLVATGDAQLLRVALTNLLDNAWKFTSKQKRARIEFGASRQQSGQPVYFVRDDGAGFDMAYADKLFGPFQRLHAMDEFSGSGVGLASVQRIISRHGGRVWAEGEVEQGATFYFTL